MPQNSNMHLLQKADMALADLTTGGLLQPEQSDRFIRTLIDQPTILNQVHLVTMTSPIQEFNKIKFGSRLLQPDSYDTSANTATHAGRALTEAARAKPDTSKVTLSSVGVKAEVRLPYEVVEDNIERDNLTETVMALMAERASLDLEDLIINGDTGSADVYLQLLNGVLASATSNIVNAGGSTFDTNQAASGKKTLPQAFRRERDLKYFIASDAEIDLRQALSSRNTALGDASTTGEGPLFLQGKKVEAVHVMPQGSGLFLSPKNILFGVHRKMRFQTDNEISTSELKFVLTARVGVKIQEETAVVKYTNIA